MNPAVGPHSENQPPVWSRDDQQTWRSIVTHQEKLWHLQPYEIFETGCQKLGMGASEIPDLNKINQKLKAQTGWEGVFVKGLEDGPSFFKLLAEKKFPIGSFVRNSRDLNYTPEPDIIHDLYGHIPFFANKEYADANYLLAKKALAHPEQMIEFERFYWFTFEFALIKTGQGRRIFGAGILSSIKESEFALSNEPTVLPFDAKVIRARDFRIDVIQDTLFELNSASQLYQAIENWT